MIDRNALPTELQSQIEHYKSILPPLYFDRFMQDAISKATLPEEETDLDANRLIRWSPHDPHEGKPQFNFVMDDLPREVLFGGAAGGGKSDGLLMTALKYADIPGYSAIIFRRTSPQLKSADSLIPRSKAWLMNTPAKWNGNEMRWTFPSGATLAFSHLQYDDSVYDHFGPAYQCILFDEATQFTEFQYRMILTRLRRPSEGPLSKVPLRVRLASNPGGIGHMWVKEKFIDNPTAKRLFIPSTIEDNPALDRESYIESLSELPPDERDRLLHGRWDVLSDGVLPWEYISQCIDQKSLWEGEAELTTPQRGHREKTKQLFLGIDIGRSHDLTVLWTWEMIGDVLWCREIKVLKGVKFADQRREIELRLNHPSYIRAKIDKGGIGMQLAEELEHKYGSRIEGIQLNPTRQGHLAELMKSRFGNMKVRIPDDPDTINDLRLVSNAETKNGVPIIKSERNSSGHCDRFWAAALGLMCVPYTTKKPVIRMPRGIKSKV